jgi:hypothetical protein
VVKLSKVSNIGWQRGQKSADFVFELGRTFPTMNDVGASLRFVLGKKQPNLLSKLRGIVLERQNATLIECLILECTKLTPDSFRREIGRFGVISHVRLSAVHIAVRDDRKVKAVKGIIA